MEGNMGKQVNKESHEKHFGIIISIVLTLLVCGSLIYFLTRPLHHYKQGLKLFEEKAYLDAIAEFEAAKGYKDSAAKIELTKRAIAYETGKTKLIEEDYTEAIQKLIQASDYPGTMVALQQAADSAFNKKEWENAVIAYDALPNQANSEKRFYAEGMLYKEDKDYPNAINCFQRAKGIEGSEIELQCCYYESGIVSYNDDDFDSALLYFEAAKDYNDTNDWLNKTNFELGKLSFESGEYAEAITYFNNAYINDIGDWIERAYFELGEKAFAENDFTVALQYYENAGENSNVAVMVNKTLYELGKEAFEIKNYKSALEYFQRINEENIEVEELEDWTKKSTYYAGLTEFENNRYSDAREYFESILDYLDSKEWYERATFLLAEERFNSGIYSGALAYYDLLPDTYSYNDHSVSERKRTIELYDYFKNFEGSHSCIYGYQEVRQTSKSYGSWTNWHNDEKRGNFSVKVSMDNSGKAILEIEASGWRYTKYSVISAGLQEQKFFLKFQIALSGKSIPTILYDEDNVTVSYNGSSFIVKYSLLNKNEDVYFNYKYETEYRFNTKG